MLNSFPILGAQFPGCQIIAGQFAVNGAAAPITVIPAKRAKFTVSAPTVGRYLVTLAEGRIKGVTVMQFAGLTDSGPNSTARAFLASTALAASGTFEIQTQSSVGVDANLSGAQLVVFWIVLSENRALLV